MNARTITLRRRVAMFLAVPFLLAVLLNLACRNNTEPQASGGPAGPAGPVAGPAMDDVAGPFVHDRLAVYLVLADDPAPAEPLRRPERYLTLDEALRTGQAVVHETGDVNRLEIEVKGDDPVFIQSGDVVKGGRQDRTLATDAILTAQMDRVAIDAYCVEAGRWSQRLEENAALFSQAQMRVAGNDLKKAGNTAFSGGGQGQVWDNVAQGMTALERASGEQVAAQASPSSLQLALESETVEKNVEPFLQTLAELPQRHPRAIGIAYAIDGKLVAADLYATPQLFAARYPSLLRSAAVEAVMARAEAQPAAADPEATGAAPPPSADVLAWLRSIADAELTAPRKVNDRTEVSAREKDKLSVYQSTDPKSGLLVHRGYLAEPGE